MAVVAAVDRLSILWKSSNTSSWIWKSFHEPGLIDRLSLQGYVPGNSNGVADQFSISSLKTMNLISENLTALSQRNASSFSWKFHYSSILAGSLYRVCMPVSTVSFHGNAPALLSLNIAIEGDFYRDTAHQLLQVVYNITDAQACSSATPLWVGPGPLASGSADQQLLTPMFYADHEGFTSQPGICQLVLAFRTPPLPIFLNVIDGNPRLVFHWSLHSELPPNTAHGVDHGVRGQLKPPFLSSSGVVTALKPTIAVGKMHVARMSVNGLLSGFPFSVTSMDLAPYGVTLQGAYLRLPGDENRYVWTSTAEGIAELSYETQRVNGYLPSPGCIAFSLSLQPRVGSNFEHPLTISLELFAGKASTIELELYPNGTLALLANPTGFDVYIDSSQVQTSGYTTVSVISPGNLRIRAASSWIEASEVWEIEIAKVEALARPSCSLDHVSTTPMPSPATHSPYRTNIIVSEWESNSIPLHRRLSSVTLLSPHENATAGQLEAEISGGLEGECYTASFALRQADPRLIRGRSWLSTNTGEVITHIYDLPLYQVAEGHVPPLRPLPVNVIGNVYSYAGVRHFGDRGFLSFAFRWPVESSSVTFHAEVEWSHGIESDMLTISRPLHILPTPCSLDLVAKAATLANPQALLSTILQQTARIPVPLVPKDIPAITSMSDPSDFVVIDLSQSSLGFEISVTFEDNNMGAKLVLILSREVDYFSSTSMVQALLLDFNSSIVRELSHVALLNYDLSIAMENVSVAQHARLSRLDATSWHFELCIAGLDEFAWLFAGSLSTEGEHITRVRNVVLSSSTRVCGGFERASYFGGPWLANRIFSMLGETQLQEYTLPSSVSGQLLSSPSKTGSALSSLLAAQSKQTTLAAAGAVTTHADSFFQTYAVWNSTTGVLLHEGSINIDVMDSRWSSATAASLSSSPESDWICAATDITIECDTWPCFCECGTVCMECHGRIQFETRQPLMLYEGQKLSLRLDRALGRVDSQHVFLSLEYPNEGNQTALQELLSVPTNVTIANGQDGGFVGLSAARTFEFEDRSTRSFILRISHIVGGAEVGQNTTIAIYVAETEFEPFIENVDDAGDLAPESVTSVIDAWPSSSLTIPVKVSHPINSPEYDIVVAISLPGLLPSELEWFADNITPNLLVDLSFIVESFKLLLFDGISTTAVLETYELDTFLVEIKNAAFASRVAHCNFTEFANVVLGNAFHQFRTGATAVPILFASDACWTKAHQEFETDGLPGLRFTPPEAVIGPTLVGNNVQPVRKAIHQLAPHLLAKEYILPAEELLGYGVMDCSWQTSGDGILLEVDTSVAEFDEIPSYFFTIVRPLAAPPLVGLDIVYGATTTSFKVHLTANDYTSTELQNEAITYCWRVNWIGVVGVVGTTKHVGTLPLSAIGSYAGNGRHFIDLGHHKVANDPYVVVALSAPQLTSTPVRFTGTARQDDKIFRVEFSHLDGIDFSTTPWHLVWFVIDPSISSDKMASLIRPQGFSSLNWETQDAKYTLGSQRVAEPTYVCETPVVLGTSYASIADGGLLLYQDCKCLLLFHVASYSMNVFLAIQWVVVIMIRTLRLHERNAKPNVYRTLLAGHTAMYIKSAYGVPPLNAF